MLLAVKPSVDFYIGDDPDSPPVGIEVENAGPGPAIVKSVKFYVDRKPVQDAEDAGKTYAKLTTAELGYTDLEPDDALAVNEKQWLIEFRTPRSGRDVRKDMERFADFIDQNLAVEITFCSIRGDCWTRCSAKDRCG